MTQWALTYEGFDPRQEGLREALSTLGNGYFATRGAAGEMGADDVHYPGTYVAGLYNRLDTEIAGRVVENEDLVNVPNWLALRYRRADDEQWCVIDEASVAEYRQELDLKRGVLTRSFVWIDGERRTRVTQRRIVSMRDPHLAGHETTFLAENWSGEIEVESAIDGNVTNSGVPRYRSLNSRHLEPAGTWAVGDDGLALMVRTSQSDVDVAVAARTRVLSATGDVLPVPRQTHERSGRVGQRLRIEVGPGAAVTVEKLVVLYTSRDRGITAASREARRHLQYLPSFVDALQDHVLSWDHLWRRFELETEASDDTRRILNLHIFHLLQTVSKHTIDLDVGVPARGWHGEAYRGHVFWDELFIFPFLTLHLPDLTRALLQYRYRRLTEARRAAAETGYAGAMYPWQSGSNGREETQVVHLNPRSGNWLPDNSHRQRHINIAIAYNVWKYFEATGDVGFLAFYGAEMLVEIARFWSSIATYNRALDRYEICGVMGPDEYHDAYPDAEEAGLDNNAYTNIMVVWVLQKARQALDVVPGFRRRELWEKLGVRREELERWEELCRKMLVPFHDDGIISQFQGYEDLEEFDWTRYFEKYGDIQRLDRILEAEDDTPNRFKASKQADVLMLFYLLATDELRAILQHLGYEWDPDLVQRNIDYYLQRTSHGSTLSRVVHSWVLARADRKQSWRFFDDALRSDVADIQGGTTAEGIHLGAMAGTVDLVQRCFAGLETRNGVLRLDPSVPDELGMLRFAVQYRGAWLHCEMDGRRVVVAMPETSLEPVTVAVGGEEFSLASGARREIALS